MQTASAAPPVAPHPEDPAAPHAGEDVADPVEVGSAARAVERSAPLADARFPRLDRELEGRAVEGTGELAAAARAPEAMTPDLEAAHRTPEATNQELEAAHRTPEAANQELEAANQALAATNQELAATNQELEATNRALAAVNRELEAFSYSVSHDLRAPLRALDGLSSALLEDHADGLDEAGHDYLHRIRAASRRMARLIDDLLSLSRTSQAKVHPETVDLGVLAVQLGNELQQAHPERDVEFEVRGSLLVRGDRRLLRLALQNLLENAWKFTDGRSAARVEVGRMETSRGSAFYVRDDGAGFDMRYAGRLFSPFQRLHHAAQFEGTGIGLAIVRRVIERHGGGVWAESAPARGATFYFTLPASDDRPGVTPRPDDRPGATPPPTAAPPGGCAA